MQDYGIDGFKFDGGTIGHYTSGQLLNPPYRGESGDTHFAMNKNIAWNEFGARYKFHEYKDSFRGGGKPVIQRLADRAHSWTKEDGITSIIPNSLLQGLLGYPFICPDMIGGGEWIYSIYPDVIPDHELFLRMAQVSSLVPMMQFSWAPWRMLGKEAQKYCLDAAKLHAKFADYIIENVKASAVSGEPILRSLEYRYPNLGYAEITDEFLLGDRVLVAPVMEKGAVERRVVLPEGEWLSLEKTPYTGGQAVTVPAPIDTLPYFVKR